ncbi:MAG: hypothetical protein ACI9DC_001730 [Gammaproteobacteria bacterium]|jgi:hypothetical protein
MKRLLLTLVLLWPATVLADFSEGLAAAQRGDFATAMREWRPLAEAGNAYAQTSLGNMYANGNGVPEDDAEAVKWYRLAAAQGNADAQTNLGVMYDKGQGVPEDDAEAVEVVSPGGCAGQRHRAVQPRPHARQGRRRARGLCAGLCVDKSSGGARQQ